MKQRDLILFILFVGGLSLHPPYSRAEEVVHFPFKGIVRGERVNVRAGYNSNFEILTQLNEGEKVDVLRKDYSWYRIRLPKDAQCYISKRHVIPQGDGRLGHIVGKRVNVRARPRGNAGIIGNVSEGDSVRIVQELDEWYQIEPPSGSVGWVHADFVVYHSALPLPEPKPKEIVVATLRTHALVCRNDPRLVSSDERGLSEITVSPHETQQQMGQTVLKACDPLPVAVGFISELGNYFSRRGTHKLTDQEGDILYFLSDERVGLEPYIYYKAKIWGEVVEGRGLSHPLIIVTKVQAEKGI